MGAFQGYQPQRVEALVHEDFIPTLKVAAVWFESRLLPTLDTEVLRQDLVKMGGGREFFAGRKGEFEASGMRKGIVNLMHVYLYHLFEQQLLQFVRSEARFNDISLKTSQELWQAAFEVFAIDIRFLDTWPKIERLRWIANTVKHAEANDADKLRQLDPGLFASAKYGELRPKMALHGEGLFLKEVNFRVEVEALIEFWEELSSIVLDKRPRPKTLKEFVLENRDKILALATMHKATNVRMFGSVARNEAGPASDVDLLVKAGETMSLFDHVGLEQDLEELLDHKVHVLTEGGIEPRRRDAILGEAVPL
jgi:predicted nucleotidyltransferase